MVSIIGAVILSVTAIVCFILSYRQFHEKGALLNNAYIYASDRQREKMNKTPYYRQSAVVFLLVGICFIFLAADMLLKTDWLFAIPIAIAIGTIIYAAVSSSRIEKENKD